MVHTEREESPDLLALAGKQTGAKGRPPLPSPNFSAISGNTGNSVIANGMGQLASRVTTFTMADDQTQPVFAALKQFPQVLSATLVLVCIQGCVTSTSNQCPGSDSCYSSSRASAGLVASLVARGQEGKIKIALKEQFLFAKYLSKSLQVEEALVLKTLEKLIATGMCRTAIETTPAPHPHAVRLDTHWITLMAWSIPVPRCTAAGEVMKNKSGRYGMPPPSVAVPNSSIPSLEKTTQQDPFDFGGADDQTPSTVHPSKKRKVSITTGSSKKPKK